LHAPAREAAFADGLSYALELRGETLVGRDDLVERIGDLARDARTVARETYRKIAVAYGLQRQ
jgi:hypothetical protein